VANPSVSALTLLFAGLFFPLAFPGSALGARTAKSFGQICFGDKTLLPSMLDWG
jgi:hypothetical protein